MTTSIPSSKRIESLRIEYEQAKAAIRAEKKALAKAEQQEKDTRQAQSIIQDVAKAIQEDAHRKISSLVSRCLEAVFDDPYSFKIEFERKRGKTEAVLTLIRDDVVLDDPMDSVGGGVVDVASFALRLACVSMARPAGRKLMVLDEPFKHVWAGYRPRLRQLLQVLAKEMGFQFVTVTHIDELKVGTVIEM